MTLPQKQQDPDTQPRKGFRDIHVALLQRAAHFPDTCAPDAKPVIVLGLGTFKIRCLPSKQHIKAVAEKYRKGKSLPMPNRVSPIRSTAAETYREFVDDGDFESAVAFWSLKHVVYFACLADSDKPHPIVDAKLLDDTRFVVGRLGTGQPYTVTHLGSGQAATRAPSQREAIESFNEIDPAKLEAKVATLPSDFQQVARAYYDKLADEYEQGDTPQ